MKTEIMYWPEPKDKNIAQFVMYLRDLNDDQRKIANTISNGGNSITSDKLKIFMSAILKGIDIYEGYIDNTIPIGGIIFDQAAADGLRENWLYIKTKLEDYIQGENIEGNKYSWR